MANKSKPIAIQDVEHDARTIRDTGLRTIATGRQALELWRRLGGRCLNQPDGTFIDRIETERYGPELPYGTLLLCVDYSCHVEDGDLCIVMDDDRSMLCRYAIDGRGDQQWTDPADPGATVPDDFTIGDLRTYCGMLLIDERGQAMYRPANRYARVGYELIGEQRSRARGG